jgi:RNA polymerase sigma factor (sigma-70 family)
MKTKRWTFQVILPLPTFYPGSGCIRDRGLPVYSGWRHPFCPAHMPIDPRALYDEVFRSALRHALRRVDRAVALEVAHDVACELIERRMDGRHDPDDPRPLDGLIFKSVSNRLSNVRRTADRRAAADRIHLDDRATEQPLWATPDATAEQHELLDVIDATIGDMPDAMRAVFLGLRRDGLSYRDVAQRLGIGVGTVHTQLARANARLRDAVHRYRDDHIVRQPTADSPHMQAKQR